jgi:hypothetical protein
VEGVNSSMIYLIYCIFLGSSSVTRSIRGQSMIQTSFFVLFMLFFSLFIYSQVHTLFGSFLPPAPFQTSMHDFLYYPWEKVFLSFHETLQWREMCLERESGLLFVIKHCLRFSYF